MFEVGCLKRSSKTQTLEWKRVLALMTSPGALFQILAFFENSGHDRKWRLTFVIVLHDYQVNVFLSKNERWVQKIMSQCLKIKSISGMTSSIRNLGKFGEPYQTGFLLSGEQEDECKGVYSYVKWGAESKKVNFEIWKTVQKAVMAVFFWEFFDRLNQPV